MSVPRRRRSRPSADPASDELLGPDPRGVRDATAAGEDDTSIVAAARAAELAHRGQVRRSGEDYVTHPVAVALTVAELGLDGPTVAAALLHDAVEDTGMSLANVGQQFGEVVARVVDGVTKLDRLRVRLEGGPAGRHHPQDVPRDGLGLAGLAHQARRPAPQHADHRGDARGEPARDRPGDPGRLRAARAPPRCPAGEVAAGGPRVRDPAAEALRRDRADGGLEDARARARTSPR